MNKRVRFFALLAAVCLWAATAAGCVSIRKNSRATVFADRSLAPALDAAASELERADGVALTIRYGDSDVLTREIEDGQTADLLVLGGVSETPRGSYTFCAPGVRTLMDARKVDNYLNVATGTDGKVYSAAKTLASKNYAAAQVAVDFILSKQGRELFAENGFGV